MKRLLLALCVLSLGVPAAAPGAGPATLSDLSWLTGRWIDDSGGNLSEETWSPPAGDGMQGMWRYVTNGKTRIYELLTITSEEGGIVMRLRHFDPNLVGREDKATPFVLKLVSFSQRQAVFEGPEIAASGLVRLTYTMPSDDSLTVTLDKQGKKDGFSFHRASK